MIIAIAGAGYVGLATAAVLADKGHTIRCMDTDSAKIEKLNLGLCPVHESGLQTLLQKNKERINFTSDGRTAYNGAEVVFICVQTPEREDGSVTLAYVYSACAEIAGSLERDAVIAIKSTVPVGTGDAVSEYMRRSDIRIDVVSNPEFLSQGSAIHDILHAARIVIGAAEERAAAAVKSIFESIPCIITDRRSAEMIKYAANGFLALKLSYINEVANLCEAVDADIDSVMRGIGSDPRIGAEYLKPGIGFGGSCLPKDTRALSRMADSGEFKMVCAALEVNREQGSLLLRKAFKYYDSLNGLVVALLGLAFKPGTDSTENAQSVHIAAALLENGAKLKIWDPLAKDSFISRVSGEVILCNTIQQAILYVDLCFICTEWEEIKNLNLEEFLVMKTPIIIDGRNCFNPADVNGLPLIYDSVGRRTVNNLYEV